MTDIWSPEEEASRLERRFEGVNQADFARRHQVPGGASMVSQHIKGRRAIGMEAAIAYAKGFNVPLSEISPRFDQLVRAASPLVNSGANRLFPSQASATHTVFQLGQMLLPLSPTRRQILGDMLARFAGDPGNTELMDEIAAMLERGDPSKPR